MYVGNTVREYFGEGFSIVTFCDKPSRVNIGGKKFYTNSRFGNLVNLGKLLLDGVGFSEAVDRSGVSRYRAKRFCEAIETVIGRKIRVRIKRKDFKHINKCMICSDSFKAHDKRQNKCSEKCVKKYLVQKRRQYRHDSRMG